MSGVFALSEHFNVSPNEILEDWTYPLYLDAMERLAVINEVEYRKGQAYERKNK